jgi:hypothetical protein
VADLNAMNDEGLSSDRISSWERWTWARCREDVLGLKHRLGYGERLWGLGFELLDDGRLRDPFRAVEVFDPAQAGPAHLIPSRYNAVPEIYCLLHTYAHAAEWPQTGQPLPLTALDPVQRPQLAAADLAFRVWPLPRVPVTLILWKGDEDVADGGTLAYDRSAERYLPGLLIELAWLTVWRLRNILDPAEGWGYHRPAPQRSADQRSATGSK